MDNQIEYEARIDELYGEMEKYQKAYHLLMEYWDCLPDEEKELINSRLTELGL